MSCTLTGSGRKPGRIATWHDRRASSVMRCATKQSAGHPVGGGGRRALIWANSPGLAPTRIVNYEVGPSALHLNSLSANGLLTDCSRSSSWPVWNSAGTSSSPITTQGLDGTRARWRQPSGHDRPGCHLPASTSRRHAVIQRVGNPHGDRYCIRARGPLRSPGGLPVEVRIFLLTLAVVDDLGAISVIAIPPIDSVLIAPLLGGIVLLACMRSCRSTVTSPWIYVPSRVRGVGAHPRLGRTCDRRRHRTRPADPRQARPGEEAGPAERLQHGIHPLSAGVCVPLFAFFAAGVNLAGISLQALTEPIALRNHRGPRRGKPIGGRRGAPGSSHVCEAST